MGKEKQMEEKIRHAFVRSVSCYDADLYEAQYGPQFTAAVAVGEHLGHLVQLLFTQVQHDSVLLLSRFIAEIFVSLLTKHMKSMAKVLQECAASQRGSCSRMSTAEEVPLKLEENKYLIQNYIFINTTV